MTKHPAQVAIESLPPVARDEFIRALGREVMRHFWRGVAVGTAFGYGLCLLLS